MVIVREMLLYQNQGIFFYLLNLDIIVLFLNEPS